MLACRLLWEGEAEMQKWLWILFHWCLVRLSHASISCSVCFELVIVVCLCKSSEEVWEARLLVVNKF